MAVGLGLGVDESYMVVAGRGPLQLGYFDHPLVSWWMVRSIADATGSEAAWIVRLPFIALFAVSTWMMAKLATDIATPRAGLCAAIAFNLAPVFGITTGGWVLPDGPLIAALLAMALCLTRALNRPGFNWWVAAGLFAGLAMLSKYTAALTIFGFLAYLVVSNTHRRWLARPHPYVAALIAAIVFSPVIIWNVQNHWASIAFQAGRANANVFRPLGPLVTLGGEALFLLPWIWAGLMLALWRTRGEQQRLLCCLALPPIVLFAVVSFWSRQVLFHWAAPGYLFAFPLLGAWLADLRWAGRAAQATAALILVILTVAISEIRLAWLPLPDNALLQVQDWTPLRAPLLATGLPIAATSWSDTGKLGIGMSPSTPVFCLNVDARQFQFSTQPPAAGDLVIAAPGRTLEQMNTSYAYAFEKIEALPPVIVGRASIPLYRGVGLKAWPSR